MSKGTVVLAAFIAAAGAAAAESVPEAREVAISRNGANLTVSYVLDEPAVVTADFTTNGVSIGRAAVAETLDGEVNRFVAPAVLYGGIAE